MPRLLPDELTIQLAINSLLRLYEKDRDFSQQWEQLRSPYDSLLVQLTKVCIFTRINEMVTTIPHDIIAWEIDIAHLNEYFCGIKPKIPNRWDQDLLDTSYSLILEKLAPYISHLSRHAYDWNIRASWAVDELLDRDIYRIQKSVYEAAHIRSINKLTHEQITAYLRSTEPHLPSEEIYMNAFNLFWDGGRQGLLTRINEKLVDFEQRLKTAGVKEPPSALDRHAKWWFEHYVYNKEFNNIANEITNYQGGPNPENIRKAVIKFSRLISIEPIERI